MPIQVQCKCGKRLLAKDQSAGKRAKCPQCGDILQIPIPAGVVVAPTVAVPMARPSSRPAPSLPLQPDAHQPEWSRFFYLILALALIPLIFSMLGKGAGDPDEIKSRIQATLHDNPDIARVVQAREDDMTMQEFLSMLPGHKLEGAFLPSDSWAHWVFALVAGGAFYGLVFLIFPGSIDEPMKLAGVGLFTATIGVLLLLGFQHVAEWTGGIWRIGFGPITFIFYIIKFIGASYTAAEDPTTNLFVSGFGFTLGVGLCEEMCKALPVLYHFNTSNEPMSWRSACLWGLCSGFGFGLSEAVMYSSDHYNGVTGGGIYWVRFLSCVVLHGMWTGGAAIVIFRRQALLESSQGWDWLLNMILMVLEPMILHGMYDTLLKKHYDSLALVVALMTVGWFSLQIEWARGKFDGRRVAMARA